MTANSLVSLQEFQRATGITDRILVELLQRNLLSVQLDPEKGILVDLASTSVQQLVSVTADCQRQYIDSYQQVIMEQFAEIIHQSLDEILDEALAGISAE